MIKKRITYLLSVIILTLSLPVNVWAEGSTDPAPSTATQPSASSTSPAPAPAPPAVEPAPAAVTPPSPSSQGPATPTGDDASTYTYNSTTGLWENPYYSWDPNTHQTSPLTPQGYSYNPTTGKWDTTQYVYDAPSGKYVPNVISSATNPQAAPVKSSSEDGTSNLTSTGPNSTNTINNSSNNNAFFNLFYNAAISNAITLNAASGDATVANNTYGGSALTGNALDVNNIINMLSSSFGLQNAANLLTFTKNIDGNIVGDIVIDPGQLGPSSIAVGNSNTQNNLTINADGNGAINNDINLGAASGNATVANNTHAGSAASGNADAVANVVNVLNSAIAANRSFLGVVNINGNLDGDILLPPNFLDQLIASNAPHATVNISGNQTNNSTVNSSSNNSITNNVNLAAASGAANVDNNTNAANASTGKASTNLTIFNLTGKQVVAKDSMLVFVNVLGQWVGLIMDAPSGTTAAALGGNVSQNNTTTNNLNANVKNSSAINNNLNVNSKSGDADVTNNTNAGSASSGNATASANIANIIDSQLFSSDWFGMLFINVLGYWHGSFGVNTDAGNVTPSLPGVVATANSPGGTSASVHASVFKFIPRANQDVKTAIMSDFAQAQVSNGASDRVAKLTAAATSNSNHNNGGGGGAGTIKNAHQGDKNATNTWILPIASFSIVMLATGALGGSGEFSDKLHARLLSYKLRRI
jgi:hypothetical protein